MITTLLSILTVLVALLLFLAALLIFRATLFGRAPEPVEPLAQPAVEAVEAPVVAEHLAAALRLRTVSRVRANSGLRPDSVEDHTQPDPRAFESLHRAFERLYPRLHATLQREFIGDSLLYTWAGRSPALAPVALMGHLDVVPADPAEWQHPPFEGAVADGFVWGRGALDIKSVVVTTLEAVEGLIRAGYQPERTVYLAFGHDEEIGGLDGARCIVAELARRGITLANVLDEGGLIADGSVPGIKIPVALVGVTEKGHASVELKVEAQPGHSSMPPHHTAIGVLARAIAKVENTPMPARLNLALLMFAHLGPFLPFGLRLALANTWLLGGVVRKRLAAAPASDALTRTSQAVTLISGGVKDNILPAEARAVVNCRILPGETPEMVLDHIRRAVNDEAVQISLVPDSSWLPSPIAPVDSPAYQTLDRTIRQVFPETITAPYLVLGATDSRYYTAVCPNVFRFTPYILTPELLKTVHGVDERIPVEALGRMVQFYAQLIKNWSAAE